MYRTAERALLIVLLLALSSCSYGLRGSGGFPPGIHTMFVAPIDNKTVKSELDAELFRGFTDRLVRALGVRVGGEKSADAVLRCQVTRYDDQAQNYRPNSQGNVTVIQHEVTITATVQIIDVRRNVYLWDSSATGRGEYRPDTQSDEVARTKAVESLIQAIINGAQSQW